MEDAAYSSSPRPADGTATDAAPPAEAAGAASRNGDGSGVRETPARRYAVNT